MTERFDRLVAGFAFDEANPIEAQARANYAARPIPGTAGGGVPRDRAGSRS